MSDVINARGSDSKFLPHPEGQFVAVCQDTIDLGDNVETFAGKPSKLAHKCALVFRTGERNEQTGEYIDIGREFTVSMGEKANLRKFLEQWRGKPYNAAQIEEGVPLHKLTGQPGLLTVAHKTSGQGRTYANITACVGIPKQMRDSVKEYDDYKRAEYWEEKKKGYADAARKFKAEQAPTTSDEFEDFPNALGDDDDDFLPF
jgi:hypothetical protein